MRGVVNDSTKSTDTTYQELKRAVAWCVDRLMISDSPPCNRCGHGQDFHRLDDASNVGPDDPVAMFRCVWPMPEGPAVMLCDCSDFVDGLK